MPFQITSARGGIVLISSVGGIIDESKPAILV